MCVLFQGVDLDKEKEHGTSGTMFDFRGQYFSVFAQSYMTLYMCALKVEMEDCSRPP